MAIATDAQAQTFVDQRMRPRCEQARALLLAIQDDIAAIGDIYQAMTQQDPTWKDDRTDGVPHLMGPSDVLAINSFYHDIATAISGNGQYPIVQKACVRPVGT